MPTLSQHHLGSLVGERRYLQVFNALLGLWITARQFDRLLRASAGAVASLPVV